MYVNLMYDTATNYYSGSGIMKDEESYLDNVDYSQRELYEDWTVNDDETLIIDKEGFVEMDCSAEDAPIEQFECGICSSIFSTKTDFIKKHLNTYAKKLTCCKCNRTFSQADDLYDHHEVHKLDYDVLYEEQHSSEGEELIVMKAGQHLVEVRQPDGTDMVYIMDESDQNFDDVFRDEVEEEEEEEESQLEQVKKVKKSKKALKPGQLVNMEHGYVQSETKRQYTSPKPRATPLRRRHQVPDFSATDYIVMEPNEELSDIHYKCQRCEQLFINKFGFFRHIEKGKCYVNGCDVCSCSFPTNSAFREHYVIEHPDRAICHFCFRTFMYEKNVKEHVMRHLDQFRHKCDQCNKGFYTVREYRNHYRNRHMGVRHTCEVCGRSFADEYYFRKHRDTHKKANKPTETVRLIQVTEVDEFDRMNLFEKAKFLKTHFSRECRVILTDLKLLQNSTKTTDQRRRKHYSCYVCFAKFSTSRELENHKLTHQNDDEEDEQNSKETRPEKGKIVNVTATESSNYKCITCDANFADQLEVKAHVHTQYRCKYFCGRCGRFFNTKGGFIVHLIQHSMDNTVKLSYRCEKCSSTFDDCYKLKRHYVMVHSSRQIEEEKKSEKPVVTVPLTDPGNPITGIIPIFDCDVCYDVFSTKRALQRHKAMHEKLDKKDSPAPIFIEDDESTESAKEFDKIETTNQITQMLGGKLAFPQLHYPNQIQANSPQPSTSNTSSFMLINPTNSIQTNQPTPTTSTAPILLNPTLPSVQQSMVNISNLDPTKTYYVVLPNTKEVKPQNSPMIPATVVPKLAKIQPAPIPDNFVMPVITSFGTVTEDVTSKKRTDPTSQYESEYAKFLTSGKQKKVLPNTQAGGNIETITIVDPEPAVGSSVHQPKIFVKKFAQLKDVASEDGAVDSKVDCAFCGTSLENSAAYREHFASHHF